MLGIRRLKIEEKSAILTLGRQIFREDDEIPLLRKALSQCVPELSFVATSSCDNTIVGFVLVCKEATKYYYDFMRKIPNCYELAFLGISPQAQGNGLGTQLLKHALSAIFKDSTDFTCWLLVDTINIGAIRLYEKLGFRRWYETTPCITPCPGYIMGISTRKYKELYINTTDFTTDLHTHVLDLITNPVLVC